MITADELRAIPLFAAIPESELSTISSRAADVHLQTEDWVVQEGETPSFFAVLEGELAVLKLVGNDEETITTFQPGDYFGEVSLLLGSSSVASMRATKQSRLMRLDAMEFHDLVVSCSALNAQVMRTMAEHVARLQQVIVQAPEQAVTIIGDRWDLACHDVRDFLARNHVAYRWQDPTEGDRYNAAGDACHFPIVVLRDGTRLEGPSFRELAERVGLCVAPTLPEYDVAIIGGGPAGLGAAVYGASEGLRTLLIERVAPGGQAGTSSRIENYLGFPAGVSGNELSSKALRQARNFGAQIVVARSVTELEVASDAESPRRHTLVLDGGDTVRASAIVLAMGLDWRRLDVPGAQDLAGRGVYYGAARTEATSVRGKKIALVGGGNSAGQAAMLFSDFADHVYIVIRNQSIEETMSQYLVDQIGTKANITVRNDSDIIALSGDQHLEKAVIRSHTTGKEETHPIDALFVFIGATADTEWLTRSITRDEQGYVCTGRDMLDLESDPSMPRWPLERDPYILETSVPGIFAVGDVRHASVKRVASAVGEGAMSIAFIHRVLHSDV